MMTLATAWGYKEHIIIKKNFVDGIEFFTGDSLEETDLSKMKVSYSDDFAYNYMAEEPPFEMLHQLTQMQGMHWANHHFLNGHRADVDVIPGFNMVVVDCDGEIPLSMVHGLMDEYTFMTYTTKRHTADINRFRLILPINYNLALDQDDYKEFMNSFLDWLPFKSDEASNQRAKKWESFDKGQYHYNIKDKLVDAIKFVPKTSKNEQHKTDVGALESLDNLERWFAQRITTGNRNNQMIKFALALVDSGIDYNQVEQLVIQFNGKLSNKLSMDELQNTILQTVAKKYS